MSTSAKSNRRTKLHRKMRLLPGGLAVFCLVIMAERPAATLDNGLALTPPMGWNSWNAFGTNIDEKLIRATADAMVSSGMKEAGYSYIVVDAGWKAKNRGSDGNLLPDPIRFPSGIKSLADYVHGKGLKFGIYTDAGSEDCVSGAPGSEGFEGKDASQFAAWGVDFVKEDWCHSEGLNAQQAYTRMSEAIFATGRPMVFSLCEWGDNQPWLWAATVAHMWRTTGDNKACWDCGKETAKDPGGYPRGWTLILDAQPPLRTYSGPGHWNDPDMLQVGNAGMSLAEARAHFTLWAILAAPLIAGNDLRTMKSEVASILLNKEVIAVDQDPRGISGTRIRKEGDSEIWARPLANGEYAVVLFNRSHSPAKIVLHWKEIGLSNEQAVSLRDLWKHKDMGVHKKEYSEVVEAHGVVMFTVSRPIQSQKKVKAP